MRPLSLNMVKCSSSFKVAVAVPTTVPSGSDWALLPMVQEKVKAGQPGMSWKLASGHEGKKSLVQAGMRISGHTLHTPGFPLRVALVVGECEVCWLLVLVVLIDEHVGVVGDAAGIAESLGTRAGAGEVSGAVDKIEAIGLRGHVAGVGTRRSVVQEMVRDRKITKWNGGDGGGELYGTRLGSTIEKIPRLSYLFIAEGLETSVHFIERLLLSSLCP